MLHEVEAVVGVVVAALYYKAVEVAPIAKLCRCVDGILQSALRCGIEAQQLHACLVSLLGGAVCHKVLDIRCGYILVAAYILIAQELVVCLGCLFLKEVESLDYASTVHKQVSSLVYIVRTRRELLMHSHQSLLGGVVPAQTDIAGIDARESRLACLAVGSVLRNKLKHGQCVGVGTVVHQSASLVKAQT